MNINLNVISNNLDALKKLGRLDLGNPKINFRFAHVLKTIDDEIKLYIEQQVKIIDKYGKREENGSFTVPSDKLIDFEKELNQLNQLEISVDWEKVDLSVDRLSGISPIEMNLFEEYFIHIVEEGD